MEIIKAVRDLKESGKLAAREDENLIAEMLWTGIHGVVSMTLIYPAFPSNIIETLINKMVKTLLNGLR